MKRWVKHDKTLVFLQVKKSKFYKLIDQACTAGIPVSGFVDSYYPDDFGLTAVAFYPMSKEQGQELFKGLSLA